jgi:CRP-like cAMP-binding protein/HEAT repeat protein
MGMVMDVDVIKPPKLVATALRRHPAFPACVVELAVLGSLISGSILTLTTSGAALFLTEEGSEAMPVFYVLLAGVSIPLASGVSAVLSRWLTLQVSAALCLASALLALALWGMAANKMPGAAYAAYIAAYSLEILYDTLFWLLASEYLTTLDMKRYAAQLAMAFGAGGVGGGMLASLLSQYVATQTLLLVAGFLFVLSFLQCLRIGRRLTRLGDGEDEEEGEGGVLDAVRALAGTVRSFPLVGAICGGILLMSALFCLQDYLAMTVYAESYTDEDDLAGFLAVVYSAQQAAELVILGLFGRIVLERGGPLPRNLIFPLTTLLSLCGLFLFWGLPAAVVMHMNANAVSNAIFEPVKTLNYAAIPYRVLGQVRMLAEGVIYPAGIALSGFGLIWLQSMAEPRTTLMVAIGLAVLFVAVCSAVGAGFLPSLLRSLRQRVAVPAGQLGRQGVSRFSQADILKLENHPDPQVRLYAADLRNRFGAARRATAAPLPGRCVRTVARDLEHRSAETRQAVAEALGRFGNAAIGEAVLRLMSPRPEVAHAAILALGSIGSRRARRVLLDHLRPLYRQARHNLHGLAAMRGFGNSAELASAELVEVLAAALAASNRRIVWRVLMVKAALGSRRDIRLLHSLAHSSDQRVRADAIEALSSLPTGRFIRPVLALLDAGSNDNPSRIPVTDAAGAVLMAAESDRWTRLLAAKLLEGEPLAANRLKGEPLETELFGNKIAATATEEDQAMLDLILFLKSVPLFQALTLEEIADLAERADTASLTAGRVVFEAGEPVRHFSVIRSGTVELRIHGIAVDTITRGASFGENAFLEDARHAVSGFAVTDLAVMRFHRAVIADLVAEHPLVLPPVLGEWQQRVARLYSRLANESAGQQPKQRLQLVHIAEEHIRSPDECA